MRIWITAHGYYSPDIVVHPTKPEWYETYPGTGYWRGENGLPICRKYASLLLKGTRKSVPRRGSKTLLEFELTPKLISKIRAPK